MVCQFDIFSYLLTTAAADISTVLRLRPYLGQEGSTFGKSLISSLI